MFESCRTNRCIERRGGGLVGLDEMACLKRKQGMTDRNDQNSICRESEKCSSAKITKSHTLIKSVLTAKNKRTEKNRTQKEPSATFINSLLSCQAEINLRSLRVEKWSHFRHVFHIIRCGNPRVCSLGYTEYCIRL